MSGVAPQKYLPYEYCRDIQEIIAGIDNTISGDTVLVAGGAGFLGSWMCETLLRLNANVICLDNLVSGKIENIQHHLNYPNFTFLQHDITDPISLHAPIKHIFHFASRAGPLEFKKHPIEILRSNTLGTLNLLDLARKHNATMLFTSTSEIYGDAKEIPTPETYYGHVNPVGPRSCYDEGKRCGEAMCMAYAVQYDVDVRIARIFNTYGPRIRADGIYGRVIPRFITQALLGESITVFGDGSQTRSFCYLNDMLIGLFRLATASDLRGEVVNLGGGTEITILDLATAIITMTKSDSYIQFLPLPEDDPKRRRPDIQKAQKLLRWEPKVGLARGLERTIHYFQQDHDEQN
ncbi:MAG: NAD-dependent epimerase/dehydratase family protein [Candidatus Cloacimonetes bacterium]|nr:NAD-dependent epimerase/dehydratase family protein [Candidatus Cloacimonadota bacterium]